MRVSTEERRKFCAIIHEEASKVSSGRAVEFDQVEALARKLLRWGATYSRLAEEGCNGPPGMEHMSGERIERCQADHEKREKRAKRLISEACEALNLLCLPMNHRYYGFQAFEPCFQGDPRGHTVRIRVPSGLSDHPEGGVCVPTS